MNSISQTSGYMPYRALTSVLLISVAAGGLGGWNMFFEEVSRLLIYYWKKAYNLYPKVTVIVTIISVVAVVAGAYFANKNRLVAQETRRLEDQNYARQISSLNQIRGNLQDLIKFVDSQREQLKQSEYMLTSLKNEHDKLKPLVEADRQIVDSLFIAQETRNKEAQNRERWIGFGFGVIASLVASFLWSLISTIINKNR